MLNVRNQPYVSETKTIDAAGTLTEIVRKNADDALTYRWAKSADGATTTSSYDVAGVKQTDLTVKADGAMDLFRFNVAGKRGATSLESFNAQKVALPSRHCAHRRNPSDYGEICRRGANGREGERPDNDVREQPFRLHRWQGHRVELSRPTTLQPTTMSCRSRSLWQRASRP